MRKLLPLAFITSLMAACAPAIADPNAKNPVFATGQTWQVVWGDGTQNTLTVPALTYQAGKLFKYDATTPDGTYTRFWYDPVDSDPEYISIHVKSQGVEKWCWVRNPGTVAPNTPMTGLYDTQFNIGSYAQTYIRTGDMGTYKSCTITRIQ